MAHLTLAGLSDDGTRLLLVDDAGETFTLTVDARLRAALRGEHARFGQLEIHMESTMRPRDIQARIRAGETPEAVAQVAQTTVDRIMPYAGAVLAERAHVAQRAQRSSVRRRAGDAGARTLGEAVAMQLAANNVPAEAVDWDAWRREDGRWTLQATYAAGSRTGSGTFTFDQPGNYVSADDDDARWLVGEPVSGPAAAKPQDDLKRARRRRLSAVPEDELPLGDDAIELANDHPDATPDEPADLSPTPEPLADRPAAREQPEQPEDPDDTGPAEDAEPEETEPETEPEDSEPEEEPAPRRPARKKGRASVPSWDEIMFGGGRQE